MEEPMSQDAIILNNCNELLIRIEALDPDFIATIEKRRADICKHMSILELSNVTGSTLGGAFYKQVYNLLSKVPSLCPITANALPPSVPVLQAPSTYRRLTAIRTTAWLLFIRADKESGYFCNNKRPEVMGSPITHIPPQDNPELDAVKRKRYLDSLLDEYPMDYMSEYSEFLDNVLTPRPVWWSDSLSVSLERRFNGKYKRLFGDDF